MAHATLLPPAHANLATCECFVYAARMLPPALPGPDDAGYLVGLDQIGNALGYGPGAAKRWIVEHKLPARQMPDGRWVSSVRLVDSWLASYRIENVLSKP